MMGFPQSGPVWDTFCAKQRGVLVTADKIERDRMIEDYLQATGNVPG